MRKCFMCSHVRYNYVSIGVEQIKTCEKNQQKRHSPQCVNGERRTRVSKFCTRAPRTELMVIIYFLATTKTPNRFYRMAINGVDEIYAKRLVEAGKHRCAAPFSVHVRPRMQIHYYLLRAICCRGFAIAVCLMLCCALYYDFCFYRISIPQTRLPAIHPSCEYYFYYLFVYTLDRCATEWRIFRSNAPRNECAPCAAELHHIPWDCIERLGRRRDCSEKNGYGLRSLANCGGKRGLNIFWSCVHQGPYHYCGLRNEITRIV